MTPKLIFQSIGTLLFGTLVLGLLTFLPAGTFNYWQGWVLIVVFMVTVSIFGLYFAINDPALMERRKQAGPAAEQSTLQKIVATLAFMSLAGTFILGGLDHRFGWSAMPLFAVWAGNVLVVVSFFLYTLVFKANSFGASNIRVEENQRVSSTGPYALVRHPMYSVSVLLFVGIALGLGSWWTLLLIVVVLPVLIIRILDEEKVLEKELAGYSEYKQKVQYRLLPYFW
jgi:protein-S-isoprenylcysteine O-methyltransferase Ste14